jgi:hypothetical protein
VMYRCLIFIHILSAGAAVAGTPEPAAGCLDPEQRVGFWDFLGLFHGISHFFGDCLLMSIEASNGGTNHYPPFLLAFTSLG